jgi:acyl-CoA synthetase (AMP-forming)/AMP-acid ligase II
VISQPLHDVIAAHARATPDKTAIVWYGREIGYGELARLIDGCAAVLADMGVHAGDRVALFMQNCPQYIIAHFGIQKLGAIACPCSPLFKSHELAYQLGDLQPTVVIAADVLYRSSNPSGHRLASARCCWCTTRTCCRPRPLTPCPTRCARRAASPTARWISSHASPLPTR